MPPQEPFHDAPGLLRIERTLALAYGAVALLLVGVLAGVGGWYFHRLLNAEQDKLTTLLAGTFSEAVNRVSFSGKYHSRLLLEEFTAAQPDVVYAAIAGRDGHVLAHSEPRLNDSRLAAPASNALTAILGGNDKVISERTVDGRLVTEVALPYHSGYPRELAGAILIGIATGEQRQATYRNLLVLAGTTFLLLGLAAAVIYRISVRIGQPVKDLAWQLGGILEHSPLLVYTHDRHGRLHEASRSFCETFGLSPERVKGRRLRDLLTPDLARALSLEEDAVDGGTPVRTERTLVLPGGRRTLTLVRFPVARGPGGRTLLSCVVAQDVSERREAEELLFQEKELAEVTLQSIGDGVVATDAAGHVRTLNPVAERLTGWNQREARERGVRRVVRIIDEESRRPQENPVELALAGQQPVGPAAGSLLLARDGGEYPIEATAAPIRNRHGRVVGAVLVLHDVSRTRAMARQLEHQAAHDLITGLYNRREFERRLNRLLEQTEDGRRHALLYLDLDQFKVVNDTSGHAAGDELLRRLGRLLEQQLARGDTVARLGGDEFGVLLTDCALEHALRVAEVLKEAVQGFRFVWEGRTFGIGVSIGVVSLGADMRDDGKQVLIAADTACYAAKDLGRNRIQVYRESDADLARRHGQMQWLRRVSDALESDRLRLFRQAIRPVTARDEAAGEHWEILLRMVDEDGNLVGPASFIPAAERYDLMPALDRWVIRNTCAAYPALAGDQAPPPLLAINLSGTSLADDELPLYIEQQLAAHRVPPQAICFEITETAAIADLERATSFIERLRALGCSFALDDFGSGMSSFAYLKSLPVDYLKIDGVFVRDIEHDAMDLALVESIQHIGQVMGIRTIAEFVESEGILERLRELGVDYAQGYAIHRPEPLPASAAPPRAAAHGR